MTGGARTAAPRPPADGPSDAGGVGGLSGPAALAGGVAGPLDPAALAGGVAGPAALRPLLDTVLTALAAGAIERGGPLPAGLPGELAQRVSAALRPDAPSADALADLTRLLVHGAADPADPACAAHLHCPPLAVAVAADLAVSALNPSLDSWDQAPAATVLETELLAELAELVGYQPQQAAGVLTSGGTESTLMALMLARDTVLGAAGSRPELDGIDPARRPRLFASQAAHFSVQRAAAVLGLGERAVVGVPVDHAQRLDPRALAEALAASVRAGETPVAVVATAGTTDTGAIDPLPACAELAAEYGAWLHVDAAYGGGALLSDRLAPLLAGIDRADSVSLDWHKLGWQPVAAGVFLARRAESYASLARRAAYLNPADDEAAGYPSLLGRSLRTTRRADAFKIAVTLRTLGRAGLGRLVDRCHRLARYAAERIRATAEFELHGEPTLTTVVFRVRDVGRRRSGSQDQGRVRGWEQDWGNAELRRRLLETGRAVLGRAELPVPGAESAAPAVWLKLTLLNPHATQAQLDQLLIEVLRTARELD
ncbi:aminotransferase class V-fold PLP-dependent enzyme [Kitasatospora acidiphila]|uniref:Aminotransferase class V-fold PLP-dependent enzyme n=1 Tax=Kitasatospora acidiphila TaxID=2567942 RepID=A0A540VZU7_9ACTN|nr:aminotransferase class V-fold PLP-dependent enzyme [Kitasatospora acidiphila]